MQPGAPVHMQGGLKYYPPRGPWTEQVFRLYPIPPADRQFAYRGEPAGPFWTDGGLIWGCATLAPSTKQPSVKFHFWAVLIKIARPELPAKRPQKRAKRAQKHANARKTGNLVKWYFGICKKKRLGRGWWRAELTNSHIDQGGNGEKGCGQRRCLLKPYSTGVALFSCRVSSALAFVRPAHCHACRTGVVQRNPEGWLGIHLPTACSAKRRGA